MESCKILVHSLVTSRLDYANILLCNAPDRVTACLERVQRSAARLIYGIHRYQRISIMAVLHELHWLPVVIRIQYKMLVTVFKAYHSGTPQYLADLIKKHSPVRKLRSSHNPNLLQEPKYTGKKIGSKSFCVAGPRFWNRLPAELREISSLDTFKKHLKTHLFQKHYYTENWLLLTSLIYIVWTAHILQGCQLSCIWRDSHAFDLLLTHSRNWPNYSRIFKKAHAYSRNLKNWK